MEARGAGQDRQAVKISVMCLTERHNRVKQVGFAPGLCRSHFAINTFRFFSLLR